MVPAIITVDPQPLPDDGNSSLRVFGQRFEPGCVIEYVPTESGWTELLGSTTPIFVNEGVLTTVNYPTLEEAPDGWWTRVRNPGQETSNVVRTIWASGAPDPCPPAVPIGCVPFVPDYACCEEWDTLEPALQARATALAWSTMRVLSGGQVGNCPATVRPCVEQPCDVCRDFVWPGPRIVEGQWVNLSCNPPRCSCAPLCEIVLTGRIATVESVEVDGEVLDPALYRVDNGHRIVRQDGECWPSCQHFERALGEPGTFSVTYLPGVVPDSSGLWAAGVLACEYAKACSGGKCRLPSSVTTISRQGVTMAMSSTLFPDGLVGIREVDAYLTTVNPYKITHPATVWSPDVSWAHHRYVATP